ncbi:hypothetical protein PVAND_010678 [Polypedilum vanderplanki]|uniref:Amidase domain-containing protein n=1 Tax=Polypedilum vanderplanki TaxID=319348 RepID=A0A9J6CHA3_POLVA|nr:hypothetical protein PVAND_010678 [Polypedilum vanderplanki]
MVNDINRVSEKFKNLVRSRNNQFKYQRFDKNMSEVKKKRSFVKIVLNIIHRFLTVIARFLYRNLIYGEKGKIVPPIKNLLLLEPASVLAMKIRTQKVTSVEVVRAFIERIKEVNPIINCVVAERFSDALKEAAEADKLIGSGTISLEELARNKPFLGVPISTKDCIAIKE